MSKLRDFNLLKVADVSSNSTTTNSVSVVVNSTGNNSNDNNQCQQGNFTQQGSIPMPLFPPALDAAPVYPSMTDNNTATAAQVSPSALEANARRILDLEATLRLNERELKFYQLLSQTLSNLLKDNNPKLIINLIDQSGKIIIEAPTLIELIAIKCNVDANSVSIQYRDEEPTCMTKVNPIKNIANIKINNETFSLKFNREFNILQDNFNISLERVIIPLFR